MTNQHITQLEQLTGVLKIVQRDMERIIDEMTSPPTQILFIADDHLATSCRFIEEAIKWQTDLDNGISRG